MALALEQEVQVLEVAEQEFEDWEAEEQEARVQEVAEQVEREPGHCRRRLEGCYGLTRSFWSTPSKMPNKTRPCSLGWRTLAQWPR